MIQHFQIAVQQADGTPVPSFWAYRLYAALLERVSDSFAALLHEPGYNGLSQYLLYHRETKQTTWEVSLVDNDAIASAAPVLEALDVLRLHEGDVLLGEKKIGTPLRPNDLWETAMRKPDADRVSLLFPNTTSFKSNGKYVIFPEERLLIQSLINRWNTAFPQTAMRDEDAVRLLNQGVFIRDYRLKSSRYRLKQTAIPGFSGELIVEARLSAPMMELWKTLLEFAPYCGIGIKTTLGMGGVLVCS